MNIRKWLAMGLGMVFLLVLAGCAPAEGAGDVREEFLFTLFTSNKDGRYQEFEKICEAAMERTAAVGGEGVVPVETPALQEATDRYFAPFQPLCTGEALDTMMREFLPASLDERSLVSGISVEPVSVTFSDPRESSDREAQYYDYELTVNLSGSGGKEPFIVKGSVAVQENGGAEVVSVHDVYNDGELFRKLR